MSLFSTDAIKEEEKNYSQLELSPDQRPLMDGIAKILSQFLDISHLALKGFIWRALKDLQVDHNITTKEIGELEPTERGKYALEAFENLKEYLYKVLRNSSDQGKIDDAVDQSIEYYKENFMYR